MMRATRMTRFASYGYGGHTRPTTPKYIDKPGIWGVAGGPAKDTLARRVDFYRLLLMTKIGRATAPFKTKRVVWFWRKLTVRVWKTTVLTIVLICMLMIGNIWIMMVFHAYQIGPSTPVLERKVREHRVSKQIMQMVRERERELSGQQEQNAAEGIANTRTAMSAQQQK